MKKGTFMGLLLTVLWLGYAIFLICSDFLVFNNLTLNEKGDFFAGIFAPVAFLRLVLGYVQQGEELKQNTSALNLQVTALKLQVEETGKLVKTAQEQLRITESALDLELEKNRKVLLPDFQFSHIIQMDGEHGKTWSLRLANLGERVFNVSVESDDFMRAYLDPDIVRVFSNGAMFCLFLCTPKLDKNKYVFTIRFALADGQEMLQYFDVDGYVIEKHHF